MKYVEAIVDVDDINFHLKTIESRLSFLNGDEVELIDWVMKNAVAATAAPNFIQYSETHVNQTLQCMDEFISSRFGFMDQSGLNAFLLPLYGEEVLHALVAVFHVLHMKLTSIGRQNPRLVVHAGEMIAHNVLRLDCQCL